MIYYSDEARRSALERITLLQPKVASIPGNYLNYSDACEINYYLGILKDTIYREQREIDRKRKARANERRG